MTHYSDLWDRVGSSTSNLESTNLELQNVPGLVTEAARLPQNLASARKKIEERGAKLAAL